MLVKSIGKSFAVGMLILGVILGAGFASGRELVAFFGLNAPPLVIAGGSSILIFLLSVLFLFIGSKLNAKSITEVNVALVGKFHFIADAFLLVNSLIVLASMLGAMNALGEAVLFSVSPLYAVVAGILCVFVACKGAKGLLLANKIVSPLMIATLVVIGLFTVLTVTGSSGGVSFNAGSLWTVLVYVSMNMMLASTVITTLGKLDKKTIFIAPAIAALSMGILIFILLSALNAWGNAAADMPVLDMARLLHPSVYWLMVMMLAAGIFTTMLTAMAGLVNWFKSIFGNKLLTAFAVLAIGFVLSNLGFSTVVRLLYPIIGIMGVLYTLAAGLYVVRMRLKSNKFPSQKSLCKTFYSNTLQHLPKKKNTPKKVCDSKT